MNGVFLLFALLFSFSSFSQCNTSSIDKRPFYYYNDIKSRNVAIRLAVIFESRRIELIEEEMIEMKGHLKDWATRKKFADLTKYIKTLKDFGKSYEKGKQIKEVQQLQRKLLCFYQSAQQLYEQLQATLRNDEGDVFDKNIKKISSEMISWQPLVNSLKVELKTLFTKYSID